MTTPKWMVYFMENPIKIHDLGGFPIFLETPIFLISKPTNKKHTTYIKIISAARGPVFFFGSVNAARRLTAFGWKSRSSISAPRNVFRIREGELRSHVGRCRCQPKNRGKTPQNGWCISWKTPMNKWMIWGNYYPYFWFNTHV